MPGVNGYAVAAGFRTFNVEAPVIFMTGYVSAELRPTEWGRRAYLIRKPFTVDALLRTIREVFD